MDIDHAEMGRIVHGMGWILGIIFDALNVNNVISVFFSFKLQNLRVLERFQEYYIVVFLLSNASLTTPPYPNV